MNRDYEFEGAKKLCASHKQILNTIQNTIRSRAKDADKLSFLHEWNHEHYRTGASLRFEQTNDI